MMNKHSLLANSVATIYYVLHYCLVNIVDASQCQAESCYVIRKKMSINWGVSLAVNTSDHEGNDWDYIEIYPEIVEEVVVGHPINIRFHHNYNYVLI